MDVSLSAVAFFVLSNVGVGDRGRNSWRNASNDENMPLPFEVELKSNPGDLNENKASLIWSRQGGRQESCVKSTVFLFPILPATSGMVWKSISATYADMSCNIRLE